MKPLFFAGLTALATVLPTLSQATTLTVELNVDNLYNVYISTDDAVEGTNFGGGSNWGVTYSHSTALTAGVTNYLHIYAEDVGGIAGLLANFSLSDTDFAFANGGQSMNSGEAGLLVGESGWGSYGATTFVGSNGSSPWGYMGAQPGAAQWVWSDDAYGDNIVYFSAAISYQGAAVVAPVPLPAGLPLLAAGLGAFALTGTTRRRKG
jgi:hypothetical protein